MNSKKVNVKIIYIVRIIYPLIRLESHSFLNLSITFLYLLFVNRYRERRHITPAIKIMNSFLDGKRSKLHVTKRVQIDKILRLNNTPNDNAAIIVAPSAIEEASQNL